MTSLKRLRERHGMRDSREYTSWCQIIQRCTNPKTRAYERYGGAGITVCQEWRDSFRAFLEHIGPRPSPEHSVDRIDNDRGYEPGNVRWATRLEQARNSSSVALVTLDGETRSLAEWARLAGLPVGSLYSRINKLGWSPERAIRTPHRPVGYHAKLSSDDIAEIHRRLANGVSRPTLARQFGVHRQTIYQVSKGWLTRKRATRRREGGATVESHEVAAA